MKRKISLILFSIAIICSLKTAAQKETKSFSLGFGLEAGVPVGTANSSLYSFTGGLTLRASFHEGPGFITFTTGGIGYFPKAVNKNGKASIEIPFRAGYKYIIQHHFFLMGELGYADFMYYYDTGNGVGHTSSGSMIAGISAGFQSGSFEIGPRFGMNLKSGGGGDLALRIGFNF
jgi:hypothetical protein